MRIRWLGIVPYREAWDLQRALSRRSGEDFLLLLEHQPVYTLGTNAEIQHVLVEPASVGAELIQVDRGGDVTYHGPGQLVGYPVLSVGPGLHRGAQHVRQMEQVVIDALGVTRTRFEDGRAVDRIPRGVGRARFERAEEDLRDRDTGGKGSHHAWVRSQREPGSRHVRPHRPVWNR